MRSADSIRSTRISHSLRSGSVPSKPEDLAHDLVEALLVEHERDLVEVAGVGGVDDGVDRHVAQVGDLALEALGERLRRCGPR